MKLLYRVEYIAKLGYFRRIIEDLICYSNICAKATQYDGSILVSIDDEQEAIERFFANLEQNLPYSIFLKKAYLTEPFDEGRLIDDNGVVQRLEPLINYKVRELFANSSDESLVIDGVVEFGDMKLFVDRGLIDGFRSDGYEVRALVLNSAELDRFLVSQEEMRLLCSVERPLVKLKNNEFGGYIFVRLAGTYDEVRLSKQLNNYGLIYYATKKDELKACSYSGVDLIISDYSKLYPIYDYRRDRYFENSTDYLSSFASVYDAVVHEHNLINEKSVGVYLSLERESYVEVRNGGEKRAIYFPKLQFSNLSDLLDEIASSGSSANRLVEHYQKSFADLSTQKLMSSDGLNAIFETVCKIAGVEGLDLFETMALDGGYQNTLSIDMKVKKIDGKNYFDYKKSIQSILSYKMAGVPESMLVHSFYDQFAGFIAAYTIEIAKVVDAKYVALCGNLFANRVVFKKIFKDLGAAYKVLLPKQFPLDFSRTLV